MRVLRCCEYDCCMSALGLSKTQNLWVRCHGYCSVVYFKLQIALIFRMVWSEQSAS